MSKSFQAGLTCGSKGVEPEEVEEEEPKGAEEDEEAEPSTGVTLKHTTDISLIYIGMSPPILSVKCIYIFIL